MEMALVEETKCNNHCLQPLPELEVAFTALVDVLVEYRRRKTERTGLIGGGDVVNVAIKRALKGIGQAVFDEHGMRAV